MWTQDLSMRLIKLFYQTPVLWDKDNINYRNKTARKDALRQVGGQLQVEPFEVERKLIGLKNQFRREHSKIYANSRNSLCGSAQSTWFGYKPLMFLAKHYHPYGESEKLRSGSVDSIMQDMSAVGDVKAELSDDDHDSYSGKNASLNDDPTLLSVLSHANIMPCLYENVGAHISNSNNNNNNHHSNNNSSGGIRRSQQQPPYNTSSSHSLQPPGDGVIGSASNLLQADYLFGMLVATKLSTIKNPKLYLDTQLSMMELLVNAQRKELCSEETPPAD